MQIAVWIAGYTGVVAGGAVLPHPSEQEEDVRGLRRGPAGAAARSHAGRHGGSRRRQARGRWAGPSAGEPVLKERASKEAAASSTVGDGSTGGSAGVVSEAMDSVEGFGTTTRAAHMAYSGTIDPENLGAGGDRSSLFSFPDVPRPVNAFVCNGLDLGGKENGNDESTGSLGFRRNCLPDQLIPWFWGRKQRTKQSRTLCYGIGEEEMPCFNFVRENNKEILQFYFKLNS